MTRARVRLLVACLAVALGATPATCGASAATPPALSEAARWLQGYLRIDSSQPRGTAAAAAYLAAILRREGIPARILTSPSGHTSVFAELATGPARRDAAPTEAILLLHHLDVVAAGSGWKRRPFGGEHADGALWGRGALDCKGFGIAQLAAMVQVRRRQLPLGRRVVLLATADEESGGRQGMGWLLEQHPELLRGVVGVLNEGGAAKQANGRLLWWEIEVAQKRPLWLRAKATGRGGHGAGHHPGNAVHELVEGLAKVIAVPRPFRVSPPVREYLRALAPLQNSHFRRVFLDIDRVVRPDRFEAAMLPGMATLFQDTLQATVLHGATQINVVPSEASAELDVRLLPDTDGDALLAQLRAAAGPKVTLETMLTALPATASPASGPLWDAVRAVLAREAPVVPAFKSGFTDSRWFRERGIPAYGVSPFGLEPQQLLGIHGPDEALPVAELDRAVDRLREILDRAVAMSPPSPARP